MMSDTPSTVAPPTCTVSIHPCGGEAVTVYTRDFASAEAATTALRTALDTGAAFTITVYRPDDEPTRTATIVVHPVNIALIQVHASDDSGTGQYL